MDRDQLGECVNGKTFSKPIEPAGAKSKVLRHLFSLSFGRPGCSLMIEETPLLAKGRPRRLLCTEALLNLVMSCDGTNVRNHKSVVFEVRAVPSMLTLVIDRGPAGDVKTQD